MFSPGIFEESFYTSNGGLLATRTMRIDLVAGLFEDQFDLDLIEVISNIAQAW